MVLVDWALGGIQEASPVWVALNTPHGGAGGWWWRLSVFCRDWTLVVQLQALDFFDSYIYCKWSIATAVDIRQGPKVTIVLLLHACFWPLQGLCAGPQHIRLQYKLPAQLISIAELKSLLSASLSHTYAPWLCLHCPCPAVV